MRKIFAGAMLFSVIGAVILGGTLAWQSTVQVAHNQGVSVGTLAFGSFYTQETDALLGPDGYTTVVGHGTLSNTGNFNIALLASSPHTKVVIRDVDANHAACDVDNFVGTVEDLFPGQTLAPGDTQADAYRVKIKVIEGAPEACMGAFVLYDVFITAGSLGGGPPEDDED